METRLEASSSCCRSHLGAGEHCCLLCSWLDSRKYYLALLSRVDIRKLPSSLLPNIQLLGLLPSRVLGHTLCDGCSSPVFAPPFCSPSLWCPGGLLISALYRSCVGPAGASEGSSHLSENSAVLCVRGCGGIGGLGSHCVSLHQLPVRLCTEERPTSTTVTQRSGSSGRHPSAP